MDKKKETNDVQKLKKKKYILLIFILFLLILILLIFLQKNSSVVSKELLVDKIIEKIDMNENFVMYVTDDSLPVEDANLMLNLYKERYDINVIEYNLIENKEDDLVRILKKLNLNITDFILPMLIFVDKPSIVVNDVVYEDTLKDYFVRYGYIEENEIIEEKMINYDEFKTIYASLNKQLLGLYTYSSDSYKIRNSLLTLKEKHYFDYSLVYTGIGDTYFIENDLEISVGRNISKPALVIVQNNMVVDYIESSDEQELELFLKKNNIIN